MFITFLFPYKNIIKCGVESIFLGVGNPPCRKKLKGKKLSSQFHCSTGIVSAYSFPRNYLVLTLWSYAFQGRNSWSQSKSLILQYNTIASTACILL